ncbi:MAG: PspC domain-containing protein [Dermatophilaceae bacterium]
MSEPTGTAPPSGSPTPRTLYRSNDDRYVAGVCGGIAAHLGVSASLVRLAFVVLSVLMGGLGVVVYLFLWALTPASTEAPPDAVVEAPRRPRLGMPGWFVIAGAALVLAGLSFGTPLGTVTTNLRLLLPLAAVGAGAFIAWYQIDERQGRHWSSRTVWERIAVVLQPILGVLIAAGGVIVLVSAGQGLQGVWNGALAALAVLVGAGVIAAPFVLRMYRGLQREQAERVRATERADIAAHLHDSVLQTLALIQRRSDDPQTVQRLARSQERELRSWLYAGQEPAADRLAGAVTAEVNEVEDEQGVPVELVVTGDRPMTAEGEALVRATREALLNAVRHGRPPVTVYVEVGALGAEVFVRDHGDGFDLRDIAEDRLGVRESILGRMARAGGTARIRRLEQGTEIALSLPPLAHEQRGGEPGRAPQGPPPGEPGRAPQSPPPGEPGRSPQSPPPVGGEPANEPARSPALLGERHSPSAASPGKGATS